MDIVARPADGREIGPDDFADITNVAVTDIAWAGDRRLRVTFAADLTAAQLQRVRLRITAASAAEEQLRVACAAFLTNQSPTLADVVAQLRRLTKLVLTLDDGS